MLVQNMVFIIKKIHMHSIELCVTPRIAFWRAYATSPITKLAFRWSRSNEQCLPTLFARSTGNLSRLSWPL